MVSWDSKKTSQTKRSKQFHLSINVIQIYTDALKSNEMLQVLWGQWTNSSALSPASKAEFR